MSKISVTDWSRHEIGHALGIGAYSIANTNLFKAIDSHPCFALQRLAEKFKMPKCSHVRCAHCTPLALTTHAFLRSVRFPFTTSIMFSYPQQLSHAGGKD